jgi:hypothetical protein
MIDTRADRAARVVIGVGAVVARMALVCAEKQETSSDATP